VGLVWSIMVGVFVCLCAALSASILPEKHFQSSPFLRMLYLRLWLGPLLVALRYAMYNVFSVLEMASYLQIMARNRRSEKAYS